MLAYALTIAFVTAFVVVATVGHVLLLMAFYPRLFGPPDAAADNLTGDAEAELGGGRRKLPAPQSPKLAA